MKEYNVMAQKWHDEMPDDQQGFLLDHDDEWFGKKSEAIMTAEALTSAFNAKFGTTYGWRDLYDIDEVIYCRDHCGEWERASERTI